MREVILPDPIGSLVGMLEPKAITNFYGEPGVGKTNICILAALSCIENGGNVTYIDSEGGFSPERLKQLCPSKWPAVLKRINLLEPKTFREQAEVIKSIQAAKGKGTDLIILDSAVSLYRLEYSEQSDSKDRTDPKKEILRANRELSKQVSVLSAIAREMEIPVLLTAHMFRNWDTGRNEIIGGDMIKYWSKAIISLEKTGKTSERRATIVKHRSLAEGGSVKFMIVQNGIKPAGFRIF
jgi:DNA repair protein RadB